MDKSGEVAGSPTRPGGLAVLPWCPSGDRCVDMSELEA